jgi:predicted permease
MWPLAEQIVGRAGRAIWVLQAAALLVLLIACANVGSLLLARAETRRREFALMTALGARPGRLVQAFMAESLLLSIAGGLLGVLLAYATVPAFVATYPASLPRTAEVAVDPAVMAASLAVAVAAGVLLGLAPLLHLRGISPAHALASGARGTTRAGAVGHRAGVVAQTALALVVVAGAGLLLRTVRNLATVDVGFDRSHLVTFTMTLPEEGSSNVGRARTYQEVAARLRLAPGVTAVTATSGLPLEHALDANQAEIAGGDGDASVRTIDYYERVTTHYFETMGIPIVRGRGFESTDTRWTARVAVVNETLARLYWGGRDPVGQRLRPCCGDDANPWYAVVGIAKDVRQGGVDQAAGPEAYLFVDQLATDLPTTWPELTPTAMHVVVRTRLALATLAPSIVRIVRDVDPTVPVTRLREMDDVLAHSIERPRMLAWLLAAFSALALLLAAIGVYGVLAYLVVERRREMAIRVALGAARSRVFRDVARQGLVLVGTGVTVGAAAAFGLSRLMSSLLFGVGTTDLATYAGAVGTVGVVAAVACGLPAWRATRLDPAVIFHAD